LTEGFSEYAEGLAYFQRNWTRMIVESNRMRRQPPFDIFTWNKNDDVLGECKITKNYCKNKGFNMLNSNFEEKTTYYNTA
jgi:hypothetical protein